MKHLNRSIKLSFAHFANLILLVAMFFASIWCENKIGAWRILFLPLFFIPLLVFMYLIEAMANRSEQNVSEILWVVGAALSFLGVIISGVPLSLAVSRQIDGFTSLEWFCTLFAGSLTAFALPSLYIIGKGVVLAWQR